MDSAFPLLAVVTAVALGVILVVQRLLRRGGGRAQRSVVRFVAVAGAQAIAALATAVLAGALLYPYFLPEPAPPTAAPAKQWRTVLVYAYDAKRDTDPAGNIQCSDAGLVALRRDVPSTTDAFGDAVREQLRGQLSGNEAAAGLATEFPLSGVELESAELTDGTLTMTFADPYSLTGGGSCRVSIMRAQLEASAKQFPQVREVRILPEELFQP